MMTTEESKLVKTSDEGDQVDVQTALSEKVLNVFYVAGIMSALNKGWSEEISSIFSEDSRISISVDDKITALIDTMPFIIKSKDNEEHSNKNSNTESKIVSHIDKKMLELLSDLHEDSKLRKLLEGCLGKERDLKNDFEAPAKEEQLADASVRAPKGGAGKRRVKGPTVSKEITLPVDFATALVSAAKANGQSLGLFISDRLSSDSDIQEQLNSLSQNLSQKSFKSG